MAGPSATPGAIQYVFVVPPSPDLSLEAMRGLDPNRDWRVFRRGPVIWSLQTYLELRNRGWPVALEHEPVAGCVNLIHVRQLYRLRPGPETFVVSMQADCADVAPWTPINIVQNRRQADGRRSFCIALWPQPGLIPRATDRDRVAGAAYPGNPEWMAGTIEQWTSALSDHGITFGCLGDDCWNDHSTIDVLIALRSFDRAPYDFKPPSKLVNAWHAGVPLVGGYDSAFTQIGRPGVDYLRAGTFDEAIDAVRTLRDDPHLYRAIVAEGVARARQFTREKIADAWELLLAGPVRNRFLAWRETSPAAAET